MKIFKKFWSKTHIRDIIYRIWITVGRFSALMQFLNFLPKRVRRIKNIFFCVQ